MPRGGKLFLNVTTSAKAAAAKGSVSKDGNSYEVVLPIEAYATSLQFVPTACGPGS